jgi:hypothetical protein
MLIRITILRCSVERPNFRPFKSVYLQSLHYFYQRLCRIRLSYNGHKKSFEKGQSLSIVSSSKVMVGHGTTFTNEGIHLTFQIHYPQSMPVRFPQHHYVNGPLSAIYCDNEASYSDLTLEKLVMVNAIRSDTFIILSVTRLTRNNKLLLRRWVAAHHSSLRTRPAFGDLSTFGGTDGSKLHRRNCCSRCAAPSRRRQLIVSVSAIGSPTRTDFGRTRRRFARRGHPLSARNAKQGQVSPDGLPESDIDGQYLEAKRRRLPELIRQLRDKVRWIVIHKRHPCRN